MAPPAYQFFTQDISGWITMIVSLTDYPRSRVPIIMASDRTGGGQPASHPAGDRGQGGRLRPRMWGGGGGRTILSCQSAPGLTRAWPVLILETPALLTVNKRITMQISRLDYPVKNQRDSYFNYIRLVVFCVNIKWCCWEIFKFSQVNGISAISSSLQFLSCSTTKNRDCSPRQYSPVGIVNQGFIYLLYSSTNFP